MNDIDSNGLGRLFLGGKDQFIAATRNAQNILSVMQIFKACGAQGIPEEDDETGNINILLEEERKVIDGNEPSMI